MLKTMVFFSKPRRDYFAEKFGDLANLAAGALVFGQSLTEGGFSIWLGVAGFGIWVSLLVIGGWLIRNGERR
jgi:hypothetical protein